MTTLAVALITLGGCDDSDAEPEAMCEMPAPLNGEYDPRAPNYIVGYEDGIDAEAETERLAAKYEFEPESVSERYFVVEVSIGEEVREALRCEPSVEYVEYEVIFEPAVAGYGLRQAARER